MNEPELRVFLTDCFMQYDKMSLEELLNYACRKYKEVNRDYTDIRAAQPIINMRPEYKSLEREAPEYNYPRIPKSTLQFERDEEREG